LLSHVSPKLKEGWIPCELAAMTDCLNSDDAETCLTYKDPDDCPAYRRFMIKEGEIQRAGWEFNRFECSGFEAFWERIEQEWAEQFKKNDAYYGLYGPPCDCGSSVCDECNPGWDQFDWRDEEPWEQEDYGYDV